MLARRFPGPVLTGERRADAARVACARFGVDTIVLDDGFQHRALARDADLVLLADDPAARRLLPAGPRRSPRGARRARAVLVVGETRAGVAGVPPALPRFRGRLRPDGLVRRRRRLDARSRSTRSPERGRRGRRCRAAGALPGDARALRCRVASRSAFPDHHAYDAGDVAARSPGRAQAARLVTTEKDLVKLARSAPGLDGAACARGSTLVRCERGGERLIAICWRRR